MSDITGSPADPPPQIDHVPSPDTSCLDLRIFRRELVDVRKSRQRRALPANALTDDLTGLAISGGGIRSASLALGVLQSFAERDKLKLFDYLSTVSGGGYIGSCWSALLARSEPGLADVNHFPFPAPDAEDGSRGRFPDGAAAGVLESPALTHVRDFANYLVPEGVQDYLRLPALLLGGLLINLLILTPYVLALAAVTLAVWNDGLLPAPVAATAQDPAPAAFVLTPWVAGIAFVLFLTSALLRSLVVTRRRGRAGRSDLGRAKLGSGERSSPQIAIRERRRPVRQRARNTGWQWRDRARKGEALLLAVLAAVFVIELQPWLIRQIVSGALIERIGGLGLWAAIGGLGGLFSALGAAVAAVKASPWLRKLALAIVLVLGPLAFWLGYLALCVTPLAIANQGTGLSLSGPTLGVETANVLWLYVFAYIVLAVLLRTYTHFINVNVTGLHNRYRDGLSRAFMIGLSRTGANERNAVVVRHQDDVCLSEMNPGETGGPYHLINAAVNLPDLRGVQEPHRLGSLEQRGRRSDFFLFSRRFCGNDRLGYCRTKRMEASDRQLNLGTAMAISGAAVSTQMGQKTFNPLLNFLLAMLNVRLGYWLPSPRWVNEHGGFRLRVGPIYFLAEALGIRRRFAGDAVYLSDGGHIENLGIFELLRRRCRFVVAIDGEADPDLAFNGLAVLQRMAFTDLGARVEIDLEDIRPQGSGLSRRHFALGRIRYADGSSGEILYIKSSVTGTEAEFIREHRSRNPDFPHESTGDQFFDEAQFEAYRALGRKIGNDLLRSRSLRAYDEGPELSFGLPEAAREGTVSEFFDALREWLAPAAPHLDAFLELHRGFARVNDALFTAEAEPLAVEALPELADLAGGADTMRRLRLVNRQLQLMERALLALRLDEPRNQSHPRNRGWLNLFRRWAQAPFFRQYWPLCVGNYSEALQIFGKYAFGLVVHADWRLREEEKLTGVETRSLEPFLDGCTPVQVWIGTVSSATPPASQGGFQVAVAAVSVDQGTPVLHLLRIRDTFRGMGLSNVLAEALHQQLVDSTGHRPVFTLDSWPDTPAVRRTARVLQRARFEQLPRGAG